MNEQDFLELLQLAGGYVSERDEWVALAMAMLDQAGLSLREQARVRALLAEMGYEPKEAS